MKQNNKRHILARYALVVGFMLTFSIAILVSLFRTTAVKAGDWNDKANTILTDTAFIEPERGIIYSDNGSVLAANLQYYTVRIDWFTQGIKDSVLMKNIDPLCDSLALVDTTMTPVQWKQRILGDRKAILDKAKAGGKKNRAYKLFDRQLTHNEYERVKTFPFLNLKANKNGFYYEKHSRRIKPFGQMAARSIGIVGEDSYSTTLHGRSGLEMALDSLLYGTPGVAHRIQLTSGIISAEKVPAVRGYDIATTINVQLQDIVEEELYDMCVSSGAQWGTCVLMEVATGEIKAISNLERNSKTGEYFEGRNNAVLGYEPGSVAKVISMMVALEEGIVTNVDQYFQTGSSWTYAGGNPITDHTGRGSLSAREIIEMSSNIGMAKIITSKFGQNPQGFHDKLKEMGFFEPFNSGIAGETTPWYHSVKVSEGGRVVLSRQAFGYGMKIPPLSTLAIYNAIANDGKYVRPHLFNKLMREGEPDSIIPVTYIRDQVCTPDNARKLRLMMHDVVWGNHGTARHWVQDDKVEIAGKTGTAFNTVRGQYSSRRRLTFCGFFPYEKPKYSCIVVLDGAGGSAGSTSGIVLKNIALKMYALGLLDAKQELTAASGTSVFPTLYASMGDNMLKNVGNGLKLQSPHQYARPAKQSQGVPSVIGLSVREAINVLENAGLTVSFSGTGMVKGQSLAAGSSYTRGQRINLLLRD